MPVPSRNNFSQRLDNLTEEASRQNDRDLNMAYGRVADIHKGTHQVLVRLIDGTLVGADPAAGNYIPLTNDISDVLFRFGPLRKGLVVRVFWRGERPNAAAIAEIIGDEHSDFLKQLEIDQGGVGAYRIFSGGVGL